MVSNRSALSFVLLVDKDLVTTIFGANFPCLGLYIYHAITFNIMFVRLDGKKNALLIHFNCYIWFFPS